MAKVTEVRCDVSMTINIGNYESVRVMAGATLQLGPKDTAKAVYKQGWKICEDEITSQVKGVKDKLPKGEKS